MDSGEIAGWIAALFAFLAFGGWVSDKVTAARNRDRSIPDASAIGTANIDGREYTMLSLTNAGTAPANLGRVLNVEGATVHQAEGFTMPTVIRPGDEHRLLLDDAADDSYVVFTVLHPHGRQIGIHWAPVFRGSPTDHELERQIQELQNLSRRHRRRARANAYVGPGGVPSRRIRRDRRGKLPGLDIALGEVHPPQPPPARPWWKPWSKPAAIPSDPKASALED